MKNMILYKFDYFRGLDFKILIKKSFKLLPFFMLILSLMYSLYGLFYAFDKVKELYFYTGIFALIFLNLSLFFSLFKFKFSKNYPKYLGFFAFFYACLHFLNYFIFDKNMNVLSIIEAFKRSFEASGLVAFLMLILFFLSSFKKFKKIEKIRALSYICLVIASYHYFLSAKRPLLFEYLALIVAFVYLLIRSIKLLKNEKFFNKLSKNN